MAWLAQRSIYRDGTDLVYAQKWGDKISVAQPVGSFTMKEQGQHEAIAEPTLTLPGCSGQELLQALWDAGLRPSDGAGSGAEVKALRDHIKLAERMADGLLARLPPRED